MSQIWAEKQCLIIMWIRDDQTRPDGYVIRTKIITENEVINETNVLQYEFWNLSFNDQICCWINNTIPIFSINTNFGVLMKFNTGMINQPPKQDNTVYSLSFKLLELPQ